VLEDFPEAVLDEAEQPLTCPVPLALDADRHPAVAEAIGLRDAYERQRATSGRTGLGRSVDASGIPDALEVFIALAQARNLRAADLHGSLAELALDVRAYFEEAAASLSDHVPGARQAETWFFQHTHAGRLLVDVKRQLREAGVDRAVWWPIAPLTQERAEERSGSWRESRR